MEGRKIYLRLKRREQQRFEWYEEELLNVRTQGLKTWRDPNVERSHYEVKETGRGVCPVEVPGHVLGIKAVCGCQPRPATCLSLTGAVSAFKI
nr:hypothetical protein Iba_chr11eCG14410 [Ipomoea batatas]